MGQPKRILKRLLLLAAILILLCVSYIFTSAGVSQGTDGAKLQFGLSASGLPDKGMWKTTPAVADINKHGLMALAVNPRLGKGAQVFLKNGAGEWVNSSQGLEMDNSCGGGVAFGDLNNDGCADLVVADHCSGVHVYLGDCKGNWKQVVKGMSPAAAHPDTGKTREFFSGAEDVAIGDVNEDGCPDLVAGSSDRGGFTVYLGDCSGVNWKESPAEGLPSAKSPGPDDDHEGGWATRVRLVDINKDGHLDIVASYYKGPRVWLGDGKGNWKPSSAGLPEPSIYGLYRGIAVGDVNEDGLLDIVAANQANGLEVYLQKPDGSWQATADVFPQLQGGALAVDLADLDKDGHLDLVVGGRLKHDLGSAYGLYVLKGDGKGAFKYEEATGLPSTGLSVVWGVTAVDVNGGGLPDIIAATGGVVPGGEKLTTDVQSKFRSAAVAAAPPVVPEAQLPRMQLWNNQSAKK
ncbi:MAG: FG-GAP repeat domain-containing protein [Syntrophobacteraceae bacterium]